MAQERAAVDASLFHPTIKKIEAAGPGKSVVVLEGFLGGAETPTLRLYRCLGCTQYVEVDPDDVLECEPIEDEADDEPGRVRLLVEGSAAVTVVARYATTAEGSQDVPDVIERIKWSTMAPVLAARDLAISSVLGGGGCAAATNLFNDLLGELDQAGDMSMEDVSKYLNALGRAWDDVRKKCTGGEGGGVGGGAGGGIT